MKATLKTADLKTALAKVQKGMGHGKILPITDYILMECNDGVLEITSTDLINWVIYTMDVDTEDFKVTIKGDQFAKLVLKTTVPEITLSTDKKGNLEIKGNGKYVLESFDEEFPEFDIEIPDGQDPYTVKVADLQNALNVGKGSVAIDMIMPCLMGYKLGEMACSTNSVKMCVNKVSLFEEDVLIPQDLANLIALLDSETVMVDIVDGKLLFNSSNLVIFGPALEGIEEYPDLTAILETEFKYSARVNLSNFREALERLDIFKDNIKVNGVTLTFTKNYMTLSDTEGKNTENLNYTKKLNIKEGEKVDLNLNYLLDILMVIDAELIDIHYGDDNCVKLEANDLTHFLCLLEDEE